MRYRTVHTLDGWMIRDTVKEQTLAICYYDTEVAAQRMCNRMNADISMSEASKRSLVYLLQKGSASVHELQEVRVKHKSMSYNGKFDEAGMRMAETWRDAGLASIKGHTVYPTEWGYEWAGVKKNG